MNTKIDIAADLPRILGRFRRQLRRAAGAGYPSGQLSESQAELLRLVSRRPGVSVSVAAAELGLVPNTASTLVSKLSCAGLLERTADPADRRVSRLRLTDSAQQVMDARLPPGARCSPNCSMSLTTPRSGYWRRG